MPSKKNCKFRQVAGPGIVSECGTSLEKELTNII